MSSKRMPPHVPSIERLMWQLALLACLGKLIQLITVESLRTTRAGQC